MNAEIGIERKDGQRSEKCRKDQVADRLLASNSRLEEEKEKACFALFGRLYVMQCWLPPLPIYLQGDYRNDCYTRVFKAIFGFSSCQCYDNTPLSVPILTPIRCNAFEWKVKANWKSPIYFKQLYIYGTQRNTRTIYSPGP